MSGTRRSGLGRGLDALIPAGEARGPFASIPLDDIDPNPDQPRRMFDDESLAALAESIAEVGLS